MYSIYANDVCIYDDSFPQDNMCVIDPKLVLSESSAGSLTITLPPSNLAYETITRMTTDISVRKNGSEIWAGRVLSEDKNFWNHRVLLCEGELAFLNDTTQPPAEYHNLTVRGFLEKLIQIHNSKVAKNRQFVVGTVTVEDSNDSLYRYTNFESTISCINEKLLDRLGGHIRVRKVAGVRYLDYLKDYPNINSQTIEFGKNLLDFTRMWDSTKFATAIVPLGARLDDSAIEALDAYLTVESVNNGSIYVKSQDAIDNYGWIEKVVEWSDVTTPQALLAKAKKYLSEIQFDDMKIELSAVDLHYMNVNYEDVKMLDKIRIISDPHGLDRYFPVTRLTIPLDQPENTVFTLGGMVCNTLTGTNNQINATLSNTIKNLPKISSILKEAQNNATSLINTAMNGYITFINNSDGTPRELLIMDTNNIETAKSVWRWNVNGLGYSSKGYKGPFTTAITMDGKINADFILAG